LCIAVNQIRSPQLPSIFVDAKQPCHSLQSPARPDLSGSKVIEEAQSSYFDPVTTPGGKGNFSQRVASLQKCTAAHVCCGITDVHEWTCLMIYFRKQVVLHSDAGHDQFFAFSLYQHSKDAGAG